MAIGCPECGDNFWDRVAGDTCPSCDRGVLVKYSAPPPDDMDDEPDDPMQDAIDECGRLPDGTCMLAGTEFCDWDCPFSV